MLKSHWIYLALGLATAVGATQACGGSDNTTMGAGGHGGGTSSSSTSSTSTSSSSSSTTSSSSGMTCPPKMGTTLAVTTLSFGDGNNGEWKKLGFDIDGQTWDPTSTTSCQPNSNADPATAFPDGDNGIDNSFGNNLLPTVLMIDPTLVSDTNTGLQQGTFTVLLKMYCLPDTGDTSGMTTKLFAGTELGATPKFDGTDMWPVEPNLLSDPKDPESSTIVFEQSSVTGTTYDTGKNQTFVLTIPLKVGSTSASMKLTLYSARATMTLSADRKSATNGVLGGVLNTEEFVAEINNLMNLLGYCSFLSAIETKIRQASDIMADGTQDPTKTCNGISVGLGFEMKEVQIGDVGPAATTGTPCP